MPDAYRKVIIMGVRNPISMLSLTDTWGNLQSVSTAFATIKLEGAEFFPTLLSHLYPDFERDMGKSVDLRQMLLDWDGFHYVNEEGRIESTPDEQPVLKSDESNDNQRADVSPQVIQSDDSEKDQSTSTSDKENTNSNISTPIGAENNTIPHTNGKKCSGSLSTGKIVENSVEADSAKASGKADAAKASAPSKEKPEKVDPFKHLPPKVKAKVTNPLSKEVVATQDFFNELVDQLWDWRAESLKLLADSLGLEVLLRSNKKRKFRLGDRHGAMVYRVAMILTRPSDFLQIVDFEELSNRTYK